MEISIKNWITMLICTILFTFATSAPRINAESIYSDIKPNEWFYNTVIELAEADIIFGYNNSNEYKPNKAANRGETAQFIANALNFDLQNVKEPGFSDVPKDHPHYKAIAVLAEKGIINGKGNGLFDPSGNLERGHLAKILLLAFDIEQVDKNQSSFNDVREYAAKMPDSYEWVSYIETLVDLGITNGRSSTRFAPEELVTRAELAVFIKRALTFYETNYFESIKITQSYSDSTDDSEYVSRTIELYDGVILKLSHPLIKIEFNQPIKQENIADYIKVIDENGKELSLNLFSENRASWMGHKSSYYVTVDGNVKRNKNYTLILDGNLTNKNGRKLKDGKRISFKTEKDPNLVYEGNTAPFSKKLKEYAGIHLKLQNTLSANYYYSDVIGDHLISQYSSFYDNKITPYFSELFPELKNYTLKPTFVFLGNEKEKSTIDFASQFYGKKDIPYGWFSPSENITVMTQTSYNPPYNQISSILFSHEYFHWVVENVYEANIPSWLNEGIALNLSWAMSENTTNFMDAKFFKNTDMRNYVVNNPSKTIEDGNVYLCVTAYMQGIYGQEKLVELLQESSIMKFEEAFKKVYGLSVDEMVEETRAYIKAN